MLNIFKRLKMFSDFLLLNMVQKQNVFRSVYFRTLFSYARKQLYCFQHVLAIAILSVCLSVCLSVRLSVTRVDQSKVVQARITKSSSPAAWKTLVSGNVKLFHEFEGGHLEQGR